MVMSKKLVTHDMLSAKQIEPSQEDEDECFALSGWGDYYFLGTAPHTTNISQPMFQLSILE